jgi:hypothetical protein
VSYSAASANLHHRDGFEELELPVDAAWRQWRAAIAGPYGGGPREPSCSRICLRSKESRQMLDFY